MMDYFKENPTALMDAMPTPRGQDVTLCNEKVQEMKSELAE